MSPEEPRHITVPVYRAQLDRLEQAVENNPDVDSVDKLVLLLIARHTDTLEAIRVPARPRRQREIRPLLRQQQELLEDMERKLERNDTDLNAVMECLETVNMLQQRIETRLTRHL